MNPLLACFTACFAILGSCGGATTPDLRAPTPDPGPSAPARPELTTAEKRKLAIELDQALRAGDFAAAQKVVDRGADLELMDDSGAKLVHAACRRDRFADSVAVLEFLRSNGADLNGRTEQGYPAVADAVWWGRDDLLPYFKQHGAEFIVELPGPSGSQNQKFTLLHIAAFQGRAKCLEWLLGAALTVEALAVEARTIDGQTPLSIAAEKGNADCVSLLLLRGADRAAKDGKGRTPLELARANVEHWKNDPANRSRYDDVVKRLEGP